MDFAQQMISLLRDDNFFPSLSHPFCTTENKISSGNVYVQHFFSVATKKTKKPRFTVTSKQERHWSYSALIFPLFWWQLLDQSIPRVQKCWPGVWVKAATKERIGAKRKRTTIVVHMAQYCCETKICRLQPSLVSFPPFLFCRIAYVLWGTALLQLHLCLKHVSDITAHRT